MWQAMRGGTHEAAGSRNSAVDSDCNGRGPATVKENRTIAIKDQLLGSEAFTYVCRIEDRDGARVLKPGTKLLCYLNPFAPERLVICREDGAFLGTLHLMTRAGFMDHEAILDQLKERAELKADLDCDVRPHLEGLMDRAGGNEAGE